MQATPHNLVEENGSGIQASLSSPIRLTFYVITIVTECVVDHDIIMVTTHFIQDYHSYLLLHINRCGI